MPTLLFTFQDKQQRDKFLSIMHTMSDNKTIASALSSITYDPYLTSESDRLCAIFVSGQKLVEGGYKDMQLRFDQEIGVHSATVEIREHNGDEWKVLRRRMRQQ